MEISILKKYRYLSIYRYIATAYFDAKEFEPHYSQNIYVKECAFSHDGKLIAINLSYDIMLFNCKEKLVSSVFKTMHRTN